MIESVRLACYILDVIGDTGINVFTFTVGPNAERGYELQAWAEETGERWTVVAPGLYEAACELAMAVGVDLEY